MELIPAIDLINGKCVRLTQGDYQQKTIYNENPAEVARSFEDAGIKRLHLVDLDGAKAKSPQNLKVLENIATQTGLQVDFSGGLSTQQYVTDAFNAGATFIAVGSIALKNPAELEQWIAAWGGDKILLAADCKDGFVATHGWQEGSSQEVIPFIASWVSAGLRQGFVTDIAKDGMLQGPSLELYEQIRSEVADFKLIASGGVRNMEDIAKLQALGLSGAIVGKAIYEGNITLKDLENYQLRAAQSTQS